MDIKILLVEDQYPELYKVLLEACNGFSIVTAERGDYAVRLAMEQEFDVILMDIRLPHMSGLEATRQIRKFDPQTPIIIFTAYASQKTRAEAQAAGANAFLVKPPDYSRLMQKIVELIADRPLVDKSVQGLKRRRLRVLQRQQALMGSDTPPQIVMEIEDLEGELHGR